MTIHSHEPLLVRWWNSRSLGARIATAALLPASQIYRAASAVHRQLAHKRIEHVSAPVISIGNLLVGGAGKTPFTRWLVDVLIREGRRPAVLHGGYAEDEPRLHRLWNPGVPVVAMRDRVSGARSAIATGADVIVLDDGFQHYRLHRNVDIVLVPAERWTSSPRLLPAGYWREKPGALRRADIIVVTRRTASLDEANRVAAAIQNLAPGKCSVIATLRSHSWRSWGGHAAVSAPSGVVVAALAMPDAFLAQVSASGATSAFTFLYRDHHHFTASDIKSIRAQMKSLPVLTTEKNAVSLADADPTLPMFVLEQEVVIESGEAELMSLVRKVLR